MTDYSKVPVDYMRAGVKRYIEQGVSTGSFLTALFENDLKGAFLTADASNLAAMHAWVQFMLSEMPAASQGSPARVSAWIEHGGQEGDPV